MKFTTLLLSLLFASSAYALKLKDGQVILEKLDDYEFCQSKDYDGSWCNDALTRWVEKNPGDAFQAGKMTRRHMNHWGAIPYFSIAFDKKKGNCADKDVWMAVQSAMDLPGDTYEKVVTQAKKIAFDHCFKEFKADLVKAADGGSYAKANLCKDLKSKKAYDKNCE